MTAQDCIVGEVDSEPAGRYGRPAGVDDARLE